ncbi:DUF1302 domain-containing protein [Chromobacterium sp. IIBBL 290-4]|uniref:DUF1302 domain-containing protein n=1 Tax=Chromobacterium sp. IIBBL 290-4 TaxID=2953890 RepID=UPI0020B86EBF|nr:DUF1302 family protein [Chromobacterium sp. IIBBL 290-4]UTH72826.1 DUF1302 domain-containing protein [Chromobacterium sp. IIBBL 290-4]
MACAAASGLGLLAALLLPASACAGDIVFGDRPSSLGDGVKSDWNGWSLQGKGAFGIGTVIRADAPSSYLINGAGMGSRNDGELNYGKGDTVSRSVDAYVQLDASRGGYGFFISAKAWYDQALAAESAPHGNVANGYRPGPLSDAGFVPSSRFGGLLLDDMYWYGSLSVLQRPLTFRLGQQVIPWATPTTIGGGLQQINAVDYPAMLRASASAEAANEQAPAVYASWQISALGSLDGYYQFAFRSNGYPGCGTFYSINDYLQPGCDKLTLNGAILSQLAHKPVLTGDQQSIANPLDFIARTDDVRPGSGQYGLGWHRDQVLGGRLGVFAADYIYRSPLLQVVKTGPGALLTAPGPGGAPIPVGIAGEYRDDFPDHRHLFALNWLRQTDSGARLYVEYSVQPNHPLPWNGADIFNGAIAGAGPLAYLSHLTAGDVIRGYDDFRVSQWIVTAHQPFSWPTASALDAQIGLRQVFGLPDPYVMRYGRPGFGTAPSSAQPVCSSDAASCALSGFVTPTAWGWKLKYQASVRGREGWPAWQPYLAFAYDPVGYSEDGQYSAGRHTATAGLGVPLKKDCALDLRYVRTGGGAYNLLQDRSVFMLSLKAGF